jgi:S-adenosylmethionine hydrolase
MRPSGIITLMTDFGYDGTFVGVMKGVILGLNPKARIVDLTHALTPFEPVEAALWLRASYRFFPRGTIHVVVVDPGVGGKRRIIAAQADSHFFLAPDNGILHPILSAHHGKIRSLTERRFFLPHVSRTFHGRDIFAPVAAHLSVGLAIERLGPPVHEIHPLDLPEAKLVQEGEIVGRIVLSDRFGNLITNVPRQMLERLGPAEELAVKLGSKTIRGIRRSYSDAEKGELLAVVGSLDTLEIACNQASAKRKLRARVGAAVHVKRL